MAGGDSALETLVLNNREFSVRFIGEEERDRPLWFLEFICSLIDDPEAMIMLKEKPTLMEERGWLYGILNAVESGKQLLVVADHEGELVGNASLQVRPGRQDHVAELGIAIAGKENRGIGLGSILIEKAVYEGPDRLDPRPAMIRLSAFGGNERAIAFYRKHGFEEVARIPGQLEFRGELMDEVIMLLEL